LYHDRYECLVCTMLGMSQPGVYYARYESDVESFQRRVLECVSLSREMLYKDPDPDDAHAIRYHCCWLELEPTILLRILNHVRSSTLDIALS